MLLAKLRQAPQSRVGERELDARRRLVRGLVAMIKTLNAQIAGLEQEIATAISEHPDGQIFTSLFKGAVITAAELLAVAIESGKHKGASFRWACNKRLRGAVGTLADSSRHHNPWAQDLYASARGRGHDHPRAIRTLGRAWCRIVWRCWQDGVPYDPARHRALQRHVTVTIPTSSGPPARPAATQRMAGNAVTRRAGCRTERAALNGKPKSATALGVDTRRPRTRLPPASRRDDRIRVPPSERTRSATASGAGYLDLLLAKSGFRDGLDC